MSRVKRISAAVIASAATVALVAGVLTIYPSPAVGAAFVAVGFPLGALIVLITPDSFIREIAPSGGPDAVGWAFGIGALITWFAIFLGLWYVILRRMRSNTALLTDTSTSPLRAQHGAAKRER
jgi:hypothetical protein